MKNIKSIYTSTLKYLHDNYPDTYEETTFPTEGRAIILHTPKGIYEIRYNTFYDLSVPDGFYKRVEIYKDGYVYKIFADTRYLYNSNDIDRIRLDMIAAISHLLAGEDVLNPSADLYNDPKYLRITELKQQVKKLSNRVARLEGLLDSL